ncbi:M61 family metallopeptidase [Robertkochia flava]|uniref:M61 family metallopeptidase n=1 Tax=Robertkochia flava TaxID=3447986 RepID=UPI001CCEEAD4|nr:PDZ domain-containing protein [Robertkochia marina]
MQKYLYTLVIITFAIQFSRSQSPVEYTLNFDNAAQNEAEISVTFRDLDMDTLRITMSRSSPGRYALHEFAKNVYSFKAYNSNGDLLEVIRPNPYDWLIPEHDGIVRIHYTLFANHADGTYSDISESHAHLNIPATLLYAPALQQRKQHVKIKVREDLNWKVATQLQRINDSMYTAPNLHYLMDSPLEISNHQEKSFEIRAESGKQTIRFILHHRGSESDFDTFFNHVRNIVLEEIAVFGEAPDYDYGEYTFLACYLPWVHGDGMEHRNSTVLTSTRELTTPEGQRNLGTVAHEFFHAWNVERLRPASLEPFDFNNANMSGALWFAEGFTSYYTNLTLKRAGIYDELEYLNSITPTFNYVWNGPGREYFNPVEMSYQAPFVDAATSVDPVNRANTFISYYSYGHMLGLALDLRLRTENKSLDGFYQLLWKKYGKQEEPYTLNMLENTLKEYAGKDTGTEFFKNFISDSQMPDYKSLLNQMGIALTQPKDKPYLGVEIDKGTLTSYPVKGSPAYEAGLSKGDQIVSVDGVPSDDTFNLKSILKDRKPGDTIQLKVERFDRELKKTIHLKPAPDYLMNLTESPSKEQLKKRKEWLESKR